MRKTVPQPGDLGIFAAWSDFENYRGRVCADPEHGPLRWGEFRFTENIPWMGIPDEFLAKYREIGVDALVSIGTGPGEFAQALLPDLKPKPFLRKKTGTLRRRRCCMNMPSQ